MKTLAHQGGAKNRSGWWGVLAKVLTVAAAFFVGRISVTRAPAAEASALPAPHLAESAASPAALSRPAPGAVPRLQNLTIPKADEHCSGPSEQARKDTVGLMMDRIFRRIEGVEKFPGMDDPERRANTAREYIRGIADAVRAGQSDLYETLSQDFGDRLCNEAMSDDKTILLSYFAMELPEIVNNKGLDCFFGRAKGNENAALWNMIDAWRGSGSDKPSSLAALEATSTDQRTLRRLVPPAQAEAARAAAANEARLVPASPPPHPTATPAAAAN